MLETAEWGAGFMCSLESSVSACGLPDGRMSPEFNGGSSWKTTMSHAVNQESAGVVTQEC